MEKSIQSLKKDISTLRTGRANTNMLDTIKIDVYGQLMPIDQLATVSVPEARLISIQVWDKANTAIIESAIQKSELGINPQIDGQIIRLRIPDLTEEVKIKKDVPFILHPGEFALGSTLEKLTLSNDIVSRIEGKSSLGRLGLLIHSTAGFIDPGWDGNLTLELANVSRLPITLYYGMRIGQISFQEMTTEVENPYGSAKLKSRYKGQILPTASRVHIDFEDQIKQS